MLETTNVPDSDRPDREVPAGSVPDVRVYEYGSTPPLCPAKAPHTLTQPSSTEHWVVQAGISLTERAAAMGTEPGIVAVLLPASETWTVKAKVPALAGVPETVPSDASVRPAGRARSLIVDVYGCGSPVAWSPTGA